jgi:hypothetical protein
MKYGPNEHPLGRKCDFLYEIVSNTNLPPLYGRTTSYLDKSRNDKENLINSCGEIYGACRHKSRFHRYIMNITSTDDGSNPENSGECTESVIEN